ncbi:unnamed protein product, partial [Mesorhabditis belari]|uniref:Uncharacterized protein n=1 Tax=Mesorhabditis belari TaxID=2138241 RepID=A0AAF3EA67_9BILA
MSKLLLLFIFSVFFVITLKAEKNCDKEDKDDEKKVLKLTSPARIKEVIVTANAPRPRRIYVHAQKPRVPVPTSGGVQEKKREPKKVAGGHVLPRDHRIAQKEGKRRKIRVTKHRFHHSKAHQNKGIKATVNRPSRDVAHAVNGPLVSHGHGPHGGPYTP